MCLFSYSWKTEHTQRPGPGVGKVSFICWFTPQVSTTAKAGQAKARTLEIHPGLTRWVAGSQVLEQPCAASRDALAGSYGGSRGVGLELALSMWHRHPRQQLHSPGHNAYPPCNFILYKPQSMWAKYARRKTAAMLLNGGTISQESLEVMNVLKTWTSWGWWRHPFFYSRQLYPPTDCPSGGSTRVRWWLTLLDNGIDSGWCFFAVGMRTLPWLAVST